RFIGTAKPVDLYQRHARLDQPPGQQAALAELVPAVALADRLGFLLQVERRPGSGRAEQVEGLLGAAVVASRHSLPLDGRERPVEPAQQVLPAAEPVRG